MKSSSSTGLQHFNQRATILQFNRLCNRIRKQLVLYQKLARVLAHKWDYLVHYQIVHVFCVDVKRQQEHVGQAAVFVCYWDRRSDYLGIVRHSIIDPAKQVLPPKAGILASRGGNSVLRSLLRGQQGFETLSL